MSAVDPYDTLDAGRRRHVIHDKPGVLLLEGEPAAEPEQERMPSPRRLVAPGATRVIPLRRRGRMWHQNNRDSEVRIGCGAGRLEGSVLCCRVCVGVFWVSLCGCGLFLP